MAKTRAQRKAERRKRQQVQARQATGDRAEETRAQQRTQVPETADVVEAELAEAGVDLDELKEAPAEAGPQPEPEPVADDPELPAAPAPSRADVGAPAEVPDRSSRRARRLEEKERKRRARESELRRRQATEAQPERQRGAVVGFLVSCWAELKRVQWPTRDTLIQASAVTLLFIAVAAAYLGAMDAVFNFLVKRIL